jgi:hypothetical protein
MGRSAHEGSGAAANNRQTEPAADSEELLMLENEIRALLAAPAEGEDAPCVDRLEYALTSGYAQALALEAEGLRLDRRIREVAAAGADGAAELTDLTERHRETRRRYTHLRALLAPLRERTAAARLAAAAVSL